MMGFGIDAGEGCCVSLSIRSVLGRFAVADATMLGHGRGGLFSRSCVGMVCSGRGKGGRQGSLCQTHFEVSGFEER